VLSEFSRRQATALLPSCAGRLAVAPAGVDLQRFRPAVDDDERAACRRTLGLPEDGPPVLLSVRRLVPRMGLPDLLEAAARLHAGGVQALVALAGDGPEREALARRAEELGLADQVRFLGHVADDALPELYRAADVFVLPTRSLEGYGMSTVEAVASGLPVVATTAGASGEVLADLASARLVRAGDPPALADGLRPWLEDAPARRSAAAASRAHACARLGWEHHLAAVEEAAAGALAEAGR
jgi:glycosyltransferase involved in cell wall biosynthesis